MRNREKERKKWKIERRRERNEKEVKDIEITSVAKSLKRT